MYIIFSLVNGIGAVKLLPERHLLLLSCMKLAFLKHDCEKTASTNLVEKHMGYFRETTAASIIGSA